MTSGPVSLVLKALAGVPLVQEGDDLCSLVLEAIAASGETLQTGDVVLLAQKIVSKSEGRVIPVGEVTPSLRARELADVTGKDARLMQLVLDESAEVLRAVPGVIVVEHRLGFVAANAGIDQSNVNPDGADSFALLLPADPDRSCLKLRASLQERTGVDVGVVVIDSFGRAWRNGTIGTAIGVSGIPALLDLRGKKDMFGRVLQTSEIGVADELAAGASLIMGQAGEARPIVLARGFPYPAMEGVGQDLVRPRQMDLFR